MLSKYSKIIHVKDCGHFIQSDQPQIIIDSIKELIEKTKNSFLYFGVGNAKR
jgi:pimeloyl-ACP methyl ester carboxylesterase